MAFQNLEQALTVYLVAVAATAAGPRTTQSVGMVALTGQWWLDARHPDKSVVAAHLVNQAWNGLSSLEENPALGLGGAR